MTLAPQILRKPPFRGRITITAAEIPLINQPGTDGVRAAFANQVEYCNANDAPITAAVCGALMRVLDEKSAFGKAVLNWTGKPMADGLPLRCAAPFHALHLAGKNPALSSFYAGDQAAIQDIDRLIGEAVTAHDAELLPWLETAPQTNESGRSSNFAAAMLWLADKGLPLIFHLSEIGSSAGVNLMMNRYAYQLGETRTGADAPVISFTPEWQGASPPSHDISIASLSGVDLNPLDLTDEEQAFRLKAYIWPENPERFARMEAAIEAAKVYPPNLVKGDAADFVEHEMAKPLIPGTTRALMHSIVWVYLPDETQARITAAMEQAGSAATEDAPLAWIMLESNRDTLRHELKVRYWPGPDRWHTLGEAHAHGKWVKWMA